MFSTSSNIYVRKYCGRYSMQHIFNGNAIDIFIYYEKEGILYQFIIIIIISLLLLS